MNDPVSGFTYPEAWIERCHDPDLLRLAEQGLGVLTSSGTVLRRGYTTGTTAAAACKAAILSLGGDVDEVTIEIPCGLIVTVAVSGSGGIASCKKFAGDYPDDATAGCEFVAHAHPLKSGIRFMPGDGIGRYARDSSRFRKGEPAITPAPLACILAAIEEAAALQGLSGVGISLRIPKGSERAEKTLNPRVGIIGGLSILGTTGLVEPWDDHLEESVFYRLSVSSDPVLVTGRIGLRYARLLYPDRDVILVGNRIRDALVRVKGNAILFGLPGLILRAANPDILEGTGFSTVEEFSAEPEFLPAMASCLEVLKKEFPRVSVVLIDRCGTVLGESR